MLVRNVDKKAPKSTSGGILYYSLVRVSNAGTELIDGILLLEPGETTELDPLV